MRVSNSKLSTFRRCRKRYQYKYVMGLRPKAKERPLELGSWVHDLLMRHYDGEDWKPAHKAKTKAFYNLFEEEREMLGVDLPDTAKRIMQGYVRRYKDEDRQYRVVDSELDEIVTLPNGIELNVVVDLVVEDRRGRLWAWDHKVRKKWGDGDSMLLDPQLTHYFWALGRLGYSPLAGVVYNELRSKPPVIPEQVKSGALTKRQNIDTDVYTYMSEIHRLGLPVEPYANILQALARKQKNKFFRRTVLPKDKVMIKTMMGELVMTARDMARAERREEFPRTFIPNSCKWDCAYRDLCIAELHGSNIDTMVRTSFTVSDRHRRGEEEKNRVSQE